MELRQEAGGLGKARKIESGKFGQANFVLFTYNLKHY